LFAVEYHNPRRKPKVCAIFRHGTGFEKPGCGAFTHDISKIGLKRRQFRDDDKGPSRAATCRNI
jgi:hypothetical protein